MSECYVYTALKTKSKDHKELNGHITTSFMKIEGKMPKLTTHVNESVADIISIDYFPAGDVTVAVVDCWLAKKDRDRYQSVGITYDYEFIPHITICSGDKSSDYKYLIGSHAYVGSEYIGFIVK